MFKYRYLRAVLAGALLTAAAQAQTLVAAKVLSSEGPVEIRRAQQGQAQMQPITFKLNTELNAGDTIMTGKKGRLVLGLSDGSQAVIGAQTTVVIQDLQQAPRTLFNVLRGKTRVHIEKLGGQPNPYRVNTPTAVIAVRGTIFDVLVKDNETEVYLHEGAVSVFNLTRPDQPVQLAPGQTTRITGTAQPRPPNTFKPGRNDGDFRSEEQRREDRQIADRRPDNRSDNDPGRNGSPQSGDRSPRDNQRTPGNADPGRLGGAPQPSAGRAPANNGGGGRRP